MNEIIESLEYTVPELAIRWSRDSRDIIRMASAENITVKFRLCNVEFYRIKKDNEKDREDVINQQPSEMMKRYIQNVKPSYYPLLIHTLKQAHLQQMLFDGHANLSDWSDENESVRIQSEGKSAVAKPEDCLIAGKDALHIEEKYIKKEAGAKCESNTPQTAQGLTLPTGHEYESSLVQILNLLTPEMYPDGLKGQEKAAITKSLNTLKDQLPRAFELCSSLVMEAMPCEDRKEYLKYTREYVVNQAKERGIKRPMAQQIHKGLPAVMKK